MTNEELRTRKEHLDFEIAKCSDVLRRLELYQERINLHQVAPADADNE